MKIRGLSSCSMRENEDNFVSRSNDFGWIAFIRYNHHIINNLKWNFTQLYNMVNMLYGAGTWLS